MRDLMEVLGVLSTDADELDQLVAGLDTESWALPTPAPGWTVAHQIGHLTLVFRVAAMSAGDPVAFTAMHASLRGSFGETMNAALSDYLREGPEALLADWWTERDAAIRALAAAPPAQAVPWLGRPVPPVVLASVGTMEVFAHGQDIADALGLRREHTDRIRCVADFAVRAWDFAYDGAETPRPPEEFRFELTAPSGALWTYGREDAAQRVTGPAVDFCLLATRRRHRDDLEVRAVGADAERWLDIAQVYRGPAGPGRRPGQFKDLSGR
jgi:uncharacterized protein (TIGR03084 family)